MARIITLGVLIIILKEEKIKSMENQIMQLELEI